MLIRCSGTLGATPRKERTIAAVDCSLPLFITTTRKLQALWMLIAETRVTKAAAGDRTTAIQAVVTRVITIAGTVLLAFYVLVCTSTLLPSLDVTRVRFPSPAPLIFKGFLSSAVNSSSTRINFCGRVLTMFNHASVGLIPEVAPPSNGFR